MRGGGRGRGETLLYDVDSWQMPEGRTFSVHTYIAVLGKLSFLLLGEGMILLTSESPTIHVLDRWGKEILGY